VWGVGALILVKNKNKKKKKAEGRKAGRQANKTGLLRPISVKCSQNRHEQRNAYLSHARLLSI